ncbi:hypothetical protein MLD38_035485 [Melastoma candidum]|uniref:Uncharacterized protein n=1 Tax=Melastoma candidum TaxID=119954 RepID=A0ACB9LGT5_9MYRT|nr:hypothetical protein MLD38_035485 [Melastoma candidum]
MLIRLKMQMEGICKVLSHRGSIELHYGSIAYGQEVDLWALGCIFAELLTLEPLFLGASDIDQLGRIFNVLGNLTEASWLGCAKLPDFITITFTEVAHLAVLMMKFPRFKDQFVMTHLPELLQQSSCSTSTLMKSPFHCLFPQLRLVGHLVHLFVLLLDHLAQLLNV